MGQYFKNILSGIIGNSNYKKYVGNYIAKNSVFLFIIQIGSVTLVFLSNFVLVRLAGAGVYGSYVYLFNLIYLLASFSILGLDTLLLKKTAVYENTRNYAGLKGLILFCGTGILISVSVVASLYHFLSHLSQAAPAWVELNWFGFAFFSLLMLAVTTLAQAVLQGLRNIPGSQIGEKLLRPLFLILVVLVLYAFKSNPTLPELLWSNVAAIAIAMFFALSLGVSSLYKKFREVRPVFEKRSWLLASAAFFVADILYNGNARIGIFLLGLFRSKQEVGVYNISLRISEVISFSMVVVNFVISPLIARLFADEKKEALQHIITRSARAILIIGTILFAVIILFRHPILMIFGKDFLAGQIPLVILCLGQLFNIYCGSVGLLLMMTGNQKYSIYSLSVGLGLSISLNLILTPHYGMTGTAIASASSLAGWNVVMLYFVRKKLRIFPTALGKF